MSHLQYYNKNDLYSQAVRVGDHIEIAGQTGKNHETGEVSSDVAEQIKQAFISVDHVLRDAGGKGWSQVYRIRSYHVGMNDVHMAEMIKNMKLWCPDHKPIYTLVEVAGLASKKYLVEIEVIAIDG